MRMFVAIVVGLSLVFGAQAIGASGPGAAASVRCDHHATHHGHDTAPSPGKALAKSCCILQCLFTGLADARATMSARLRDMARAPDDLGAPGLTVEPAVPPPRA